MLLVATGMSVEYGSMQVCATSTTCTAQTTNTTRLVDTGDLRDVSNLLLNISMLNMFCSSDICSKYLPGTVCLCMPKVLRGADIAFRIHEIDFPCLLFGLIRIWAIFALLLSTLHGDHTDCAGAV